MKNEVVVGRCENAPVAALPAPRQVLKEKPWQFQRHELVSNNTTTARPEAYRPRQGH